MLTGKTFWILLGRLPRDTFLLLRSHGGPRLGGNTRFTFLIIYEGVSPPSNLRATCTWVTLTPLFGTPSVVYSTKRVMSFRQIELFPLTSRTPLAHGVPLSWVQRTAWKKTTTETKHKSNKIYIEAALLALTSPPLHHTNIWKPNNFNN